MICKRCGGCCSIFPHRHIKLKDYKMWEDAGRFDIIDRINDDKKADATGCIFLRRRVSDAIYQCEIYDLRPGICRDFPKSRDHAIKYAQCEGVYK